MFERVKEAIRRLVSGPGEKPFNCEARALEVQVECGRCGEVITVRVDRDHEIEPQYAPDAEEGDHPVRWVLRKEVVGAQCQNIIRFTITFGSDQYLQSSSIEGGRFLLPELEAARADSGEQP